MSEQLQSWPPRTSSDTVMLSQTPSGDRLFAMIYAYLDASKTQDREGITVVAGYLASLEEWQRIEKDWEQALTGWKLPRFHIRELRRWVGRANVKDCIAYFVNLIKPSDLAGVAACVVDKNWDKRIHVSSNVSFQPDQYRQCLQRALGLIVEVADNHYHGQQISVTCDCDADQKLVEPVFDAVQQKHPALLSLTVRRSGQIRPLEAADLIAQVIRRKYLEAYDAKREEYWPERDPDLPSGLKGLAISVSRVVKGPIWIITYSTDFGFRA
jgi:hypothetical protein